MRNLSSRAVAAQIIARWLATGDFPNRILNSAPPSGAFVTEVVQGVVRWKRFLEWVIRQHVKSMPPPSLKSILLTGLYQILIMQNEADYAAVNETVKLTKSDFSKKQTDFVNAVLRRCAAERDSIAKAANKLPPGIRHSHPDLLLKRWTKARGAKATLRLCAWNNTRPDVFIKINLLRSPGLVRSFAAQLKRRGVLPSANFDGYFLLPRGLRIEDLPGYAEGMFLVIAPFAANAIDLLAPRPDENILDSCAAPGGKTFLIAEKMRFSGKLQAFDVSEDRILIMKTNFQRLQISDFAAIKKQNILGPMPADNRKYDRILADVPCSNTGVIRRKPDVRWRFSLNGLNLIVKTQTKMLDRLAPLLKPGGTLVYSTCSLEPEENRGQITKWLAKHPDFRLAGERSFFPPDSGTDGGYAAAITRR
ncbi:MAG: transcription antitermination factor NusB [Kiritimatiellae bacterium]|nr:transcription antitermination factor NusB [Kiritimatiellia bacterium]